MSKFDKILTVILIISIVVSITVLIYIIVTPKQSEKFTEFYILGPNDKAADYPNKYDSRSKCDYYTWSSKS